MCNFSLILLAMVCLGMSGGGNKYMQPAAPAVAQSQPDPDESKIALFRATSFSGAIQSWVREKVNDKIEYVVVISAGSKFTHITTPRRHLYRAGKTTNSWKLQWKTERHIMPISLHILTDEGQDLF